MINELITTVYSLHIHIFQRRSQVKWLTHVKLEKNACPASALFQCSSSSGLTPPPPVIRPPNAAADHQFVGAQLWDMGTIL